MKEGERKNLLAREWGMVFAIVAFICALWVISYYKRAQITSCVKASLSLKEEVR